MYSSPEGDTKMKTMKMHQQSGLDAPASLALCTTEGPARIHNNYSGGNGQYGANGSHLQISTLPDGTIVLDAEAAAGLVYMIEEEKMARDLYDTFFEQTGSVVFDRISTSEQKHMDSLLAVADNAGIDISGVSVTVGVFSNATIQTLYDSLLAQGSVSADAAYDVGVLVEQTDIADLQNYANDAEIGIVGTVYAHLELGSEHHLAAFSQYADLA
jgi:hypothetical protein